MWKSAEIYIRKTRRCLAFLFSAFLFISTAFSATLPSGYTELESLSSSDYYPYVQDDTLTSLDAGTIEIKVSNVSAGDTRFVGWGNRSNAAEADAMIAKSVSGVFVANYGGDYHWFGVPTTNIDYDCNNVNIVKYEFAPELQRVWINGILSKTSNQPTRVNHNYPFRLFNASVNWGGGSTIYYCKVYDYSANLLREYIPARRNSDNVLGMYDTVNDKFFTNAGTGTFTAGPVVNLPSDYTELEYIESDGNTCIDTGYKWTTDITETSIEYWLLSTSTSNFALFGSESGNPFYGGVLYGHSWQVGYMVGSTQWANLFVPDYNVWETYIAKTTSSTQGSTNRNGTETAFTYSGGVSKVYSSGLFCAHKQGSYQQFSKARVRKFYMKDNGILVRDMVPVKRNSDNVLGMYDKVSGQFFTNAGTGTFTAGPVVNWQSEYTELEYIDLDSTYIDTGLYLYTDQSTNHYPNIHYTFMPLRYRTDSTMTNYVGTRSPGLDGGLGLLLGSTDNFSYIDYFDGTRYSGSSGTGVQLNTKYEYDIVNRSATLKDVTNGTTLLSHTFGDSNQNSTKSLTLNALNVTGAGTVGGGDNKLRIYDFEVEGESNLIPAKRNSDNAIGMYDTIRNIFILPNSGTATAGPEIAAPATIAIHWGGVAEPDASGMCVYGETFTAPSTAPTAVAGYKFLGWRPM